MELKPIGATALTPPTFYFWQPEQNIVIELTQVDENLHLLRGSKSYRLLKQDLENQQETWHSNLVNLHDWMSERFSSFQLTASYTNEPVVEATGITSEAEELSEEAEPLLQRHSKLLDKVEGLEERIQYGSVFEDGLKNQLENANKELKQVENRLHRIDSQLERLKQERGEWRKNGVMLAYLFTYHTDPELVASENLERIIGDHVQELRNDQRRLVNKLTGSKFKFAIEELEEPRIYNRLQYTSLLNPSVFEEVVERNPELEDRLNEIRGQTLHQYQAYALHDLETGDGTFEWRDVTPVQAVRSIVTQLETAQLSGSTQAPTDGPMIGTLAGTQQKVGFDPAEKIPHYYLAGQTRSGKSYTKRVLMENCIAMDYDVLSISPAPDDIEEFGLSFPNPEHDDGTGIAADHYYPDHDQLLDLPEDLSELFTGVNTVVFDGTPQQQIQRFVDELMGELRDVGERSPPLFVFIEEAHNFADSDQSANAIQKIIRESAKFGVHMVLVSQSPGDFTYTHKHIRENTETIFHNMEDTQYASQFLQDGQEVTRLDQGQAILQGMNFDRPLTIDVRQALTLPTNPTPDQIQELDERLEGEAPEISVKHQVSETGTSEKETTAAASTEELLSENEQKLLDYVHQYIEETDKEPSTNQMSSRYDGPFSRAKTEGLVQELVEKGVLADRTADERPNNPVVYYPT